MIKSFHPIEITSSESGDIYAITFYHFRKFDENAWAVRLMLKSFLTFIIQFLLFFYIMVDKKIFDWL